MCKKKPLLENHKERNPSHRSLWGLAAILSSYHLSSPSPYLPPYSALLFCFVVSKQLSWNSVIVEIVFIFWLTYTKIWLWLLAFNMGLELHGMMWGWVRFGFSQYDIMGLPSMALWISSGCLGRCGAVVLLLSFCLIIFRYSLEVCCGLLVLLFLTFGFRYIYAVFAVGA